MNTRVTNMTNLPVVEPPAAPTLRESGQRAVRAPHTEEIRLSLGVGKEVSIRQLLKALTFKRIWNAVKVLASFVWSALCKKTWVWGVPPIVTIEPTNICNLRCPLCVTGNGSMERPYGRMDFDTYKRLIDELGDRIMYIVLYQQGEPYLNRQFHDFVSYARRRKIYVTTSSNAHYFDRQTAEATVRSGLDTIIVSVDGATQETYAHYRVGGSLDKVKAGIQTLVAAKKRMHSKTPYIYLQFLLMKHNEHELPAMKRLARELGVDRFLMKNIQVETLQEAHEWLPREESFRRYRLTENDFTVKRGGKGVCIRPWLTTLVNWDGTVVPCCFDKHGHHVVGDMRQPAGFTQIWNSEKYTEFRQHMVSNRDAIDICRNCNQGLGLFL